MVAFLATFAKLVLEDISTGVELVVFVVAEGAGASCDNFTRMMGEEKVNPDALNLSHPSLSETTVVATELTPEAFCTETVAEIGAVVKL